METAMLEAWVSRHLYSQEKCILGTEIRHHYPGRSGAPGVRGGTIIRAGKWSAVHFSGPRSTFRCRFWWTRNRCHEPRAQSDRKCIKSVQKTQGSWVSFSDPQKGPCTKPRSPRNAGRRIASLGRPCVRAAAWRKAPPATGRNAPAAE